MTSIEGKSTGKAFARRCVAVLLACSLMGVAVACGSSPASTGPTRSGAPSAAQIAKASSIDGTPMPTRTFARIYSPIPATGEGFRMYFLKVGWGDLGMIGVYDLERSWAFLSQVDMRDATFVMNSADVEVYNWTRQEITLTEAGTNRFWEAWATPSPAPGWWHTCFVVTFNGVRVYGGIQMDNSSAMGISFPVYYVETVGRRYMLRMRPLHSGVATYDSWPEALKSRIEIPEIREYFEALGKLVFDPQPTVSPSS